MGILLNSAYLMLVEGKRKAFNGHVLQLGKQSVHFSYPSLKNLADHVGITLVDIGLNNQDERRLTDVEFFRSIGFSSVSAMEFGTSEGAEYVWDLNHKVPGDWHEIADFIYDGGTIEHIFHVPNCMDSVARMLKIGGRVFHEAIASGGVDHGLYSIQPTLFYDFYGANQFERNLFTISKMKLESWMTHTGIQIPYEPGMYDFEKTWSFEKETFYVGVFFATKVLPYKDMVIPQQSIWARHKASQ